MKCNALKMATTLQYVARAVCLGPLLEPFGEVAHVGRTGHVKQWLTRLRLYYSRVPCQLCAEGTVRFGTSHSVIDRHCA